MREWLKAIAGGVFWTVIIIIILLASTGGETPFIYTRF